jgi:hypothetical protein
MEDDIELVSDDKTEIIQNNINNITWIILQNYTKWNTIDILRYQTYIISFIKQNFSIFVSTNIEYKIKEFIEKCDVRDDFFKYINWLIATTLQLCKINKQELLKQKHADLDNSCNNQDLIIARSSYKFCVYRSKCINKYKNNNCTKHHFVYDLLYADLNSLINYVEYSKKISIDEIMKSINTINYVLHHMLNELMEI